MEVRVSGEGEVGGGGSDVALPRWKEDRRRDAKETFPQSRPVMRAGNKAGVFTDI